MIHGHPVKVVVHGLGGQCVMYIPSHTPYRQEEMRSDIIIVFLCSLDTYS